MKLQLRNRNEAEIERVGWWLGNASLLVKVLLGTDVYRRIANVSYADAGFTLTPLCRNGSVSCNLSSWP